LLLLLLLLLGIWVEDSVSERSGAEKDEYFFPWRWRWRHFLAVVSHSTTVFSVFLWMSYADPFLILAVAIAFAAAFSSLCTGG